MRNHLTSVLVAGLLALAPAAFADTDTDNLTVTASVQTSCQITGGTLAFGVYDTIGGAAVDASTSVSVECTAGTIATITLGQGDHADTGSSDSAPLRRMSNGVSSYLSYFLFSNSERDLVWANTAGTGVEYSASNANAANLTVYGRLSAGQDVPAGSYSDTVVATVTF